VRPPLRFPADVEDLLVDEILATAMGEGNYPGDSRRLNGLRCRRVTGHRQRAHRFPDPSWRGAPPGQPHLGVAVSSP